MTTMMRTRRTADGAKWAELFGKAVREGVEVRQTGSGLWIATSGTDRTAAYVVSLPECECPGHTYHGHCKHRAMLAWTLGVLTLGGDAGPDPEPPTPAAPAGAVARRAAFGMIDRELVAAKADAMRQHLYHGAPLISPVTGKVIAQAA
ncbi:MAG: hypothetical protein M3440_02200 [Chloroflexota bacterium]|nr:hypothetical protein [Chloroflexota bacterium]